MMKAMLEEHSIRISVLRIIPVEKEYVISV